MRKYIVQMVVALSVVMIAQTVAAQQLAEAAVLRDIAQAFEETAAVDTMQVTSLSVTDAPGGGAAIEQNSTATLSQTDEGWEGSSEMTMTAAAPVGNISITSETVWINGVTYIRFTEVPRRMSAELPTEWTDVSTLTDAGGAMMGGESDGALRLLTLPVSAETVSAIGLLPEDTINDQAMTVYQVTFDTDALIDSDATGLLDMRTPEMPGQAAGGLRGNAGGRDSFEAPDPTTLQLTVAVYIGQTDGLVHRIYSVIESTDTSQPSLTVTNQVDFTAFNEPVEIVAPEVGS